MSEPSSPRPGRRPGANTTRAAILDAARVRFAAEGFAATTIRSVAQDAGVDASLVMQFFGSKNDLFAAVMSLPRSVLDRLDEAFAGDGPDRGERVVRTFLDVWEGPPEHAGPLHAMLRGAVANELARQQLSDFLQARLTAGVVADDAALRAGVVASMLVGLVFGRDVVAVPVLAGADRERLTALVAPAVQTLLTPAGRGPRSSPTP